MAPIAFFLMWATPAHSLLKAPAAGEGQIISPAEAKIDEALQALLVDGAPGEVFRFIIHLESTDAFDLNTYPEEPVLRRTVVVQRLQQAASASQASLIRQLEAWKSSGRVTAFQPFWIINGIAARGTADVIYQIAARSDVARISLDAQHRYFQPPASPLDTILRALQPEAGETASWGLERIRAPHVWEGLGIDGQGTTIAIMDTGVDWLHPDLVDNYRGNLGDGNVIHNGNWFNAASPSITEPVDFIGHGTHVAGTAVGRNGIGVAPGASWIAVAISDQNGFIYDSAIHSGFQWLMAPGGDPALAPDIVNGSWGNASGSTAYQDDVNALHAAGIIPVFAAGNGGPITRSVGAPASYADTLAVGASDDIDTTAWFSSRGPSPLTDELKPLLVAPGTYILSALPGGQYGYANGTSMATPHVAGTIALLLSANPSLSRQAVSQILAETAVQLEPVRPNNTSGWGRLDAYSAVATQVQTGSLRGTITKNGLPLPHITVTVSTMSGAQLSYQTDENGVYNATVRPGLYNVRVAPFGLTPGTAQAVAVAADQTTWRNFNLASLPSGTIRGAVREAGTGIPLEATISVPGTPVTAVTNSDGSYSLFLPAGRYEVIASVNGYRLGRATLSISAGQSLTSDFALIPGPSILLIDSGQWYYNSYAGYYQASLAADNRTFDLWTIRNPFTDVPTTSTLANYDAVIWSAPLDSPGFVGASHVITNYLGTGGNMLISGQDVGYYDGDSPGTQVWWYRNLQAAYTGEGDAGERVAGADNTLFEDLVVDLNGSGGAANQITPDRTVPHSGSLTRPIFYYDDGQIAGLQAGHCQPFRLVYLGFGLEGVAGVENQAAILDRTFDYFLSPRTAVGVGWLQTDVDDFAVSGSLLTYTLSIRNLSEVMTDTFTLNISDASWPTSLVTSTLTLGPCQTGDTVLTINAPAGAAPDTVHTMQVTAVSSNNNSFTAQLSLRHKIPGHILLVDDDRWYNQEAVFKSTLDSMNLDYDIWEIGWDNNVRGSPPADFLNAYDIVIWYTGYDWFAPILPAEREALADYMAQGGRLFLNSQDYLYYNYDTPFTRNFLGILSYQESITPTRAYAGQNPALPNSLAGPLTLHYNPYQNFSDGVIPAPGSQPFLWHDQGMAAGVATTGEAWRTVFWSLPLETLPPKEQADAMKGIIGWLSDLGDSTFKVDQVVGEVNVPRAYTLTLHNLDNGVSNFVMVTNTLPAGLDIVPGSIVGGAGYQAATRQVTWQGRLDSGGSHQIRYLATPAASLVSGSRLDNRVAIHYERHNLRFERTATMWVEAPDLSSSTLTAVSALPLPEQIVTYTLQLHNSGLAPTEMVSVVVRLPDSLALLTDTLSFSGGFGTVASHRIFWEGDMNPGDTITVSLVTTRTTPLDANLWWQSATAVIDDGVTDPLIRNNLLFLPPDRNFFPFFAKK